MKIKLHILAKILNKMDAKFVISLDEHIVKDGLNYIFLLISHASNYGLADEHMVGKITPKELRELDRETAFGEERMRKTVMFLLRPLDPEHYRQI